MELADFSSPSVVTSPDRVRPSHMLSASAAIPVVEKQSAVLRPQTSSGVTVATAKAPPSVPEKLFDALATAKVWMSKVAMHFPKENRDRLYKQLNLLHDFDEWFEGDAPVQLASFQSFVRTVLHHGISTRPALSLSPSGNLLALWSDGGDKLTIEFLPGNRARWLVVTSSRSGPENATGTTPIERVREVLMPYNEHRWFDAG